MSAAANCSAHGSTVEEPEQALSDVVESLIDNPLREGIPMFEYKKITGIAVAGALLATTAACVTDPVTGERKISKAAIGAGVGLVGGYLAGDVIGGRSDRTEKIVGAGIGAVAGGAIGAYMDKQERELREKTAGTGVDITR